MTISTVGLRSLAALLAVAAASSSVAAQQRDTVRLDSVVVTATRTDLALPAASAAATVLRGDDLRARGLVHLGDALRSVPGVTVVRGGSWGSVTSLFVRGGESDYVKVLIDGIPLNAAGGAIDLSTISLDGVDRIEVVRGPASVLYGSDAVTGVVQIFTVDGSGGPAGIVDVRGGDHAWREGSVSIGGGSRVHVSGTAARRATDGIHAFNSDHESDTYDATVRFRAPSGLDLRLDARLADVETHVPTNGQGQVVDSNQVRTERRTLVGLGAGWFLGSHVQARLEASRAETDDVSDNPPDSPGDTLGFYSRTESSGIRERVDARVDVHAHERALVTVGAEWSRQREESHGTSVFGTGSPTDTRFDASRHNRALYAQVLPRGLDRVSATLGARLDENERFGTFVTGRAAVAARVHATTLRAAAGSAFREPAFIEHFTTAFSVGNPALDPERTMSWEVGVAQEVAHGRLQLSATWFDQRFRDMIQYVSQSDPTSPNYVNLAAARADGLELEARLPSLGVLDAAASWTMVRSRVTDAGTGDFGAFEEGKPLLRRPRHTVNLLTRWGLGGRGSLSITATRVGRRDDVDFSTFPGTRRELEPYTLVDVGVELDVLPGSAPASSLRLTARLENALDEDYQTVYGFDTPGRTLFVGARALIGR